jgi:hypothetical protein
MAADTASYAQLGRNVIDYILSPEVVAAQVDASLANTVIEGESVIALVTLERHSVTPHPATAVSRSEGVLLVTLPLDIRLRIEFPIGHEEYNFGVKVLLTLTAEVTGPLAFFLACAPVTEEDVTVVREELVHGLVNLEFFISGELKKKVAEEVNRMLKEKEAERRVDLGAHIAQALGSPPPRADLGLRRAV